MKKDEVLIDLENFSHDKQVEGARSVFQKIEQTIRKGNHERCACIVAHLDTEDSPKNSVFMCGNPKMTHALLVEALVTAITNGVVAGAQNKVILLNALKLLSRVDVEQLHLDDSKKLTLQKAIANIGVIAFTC